MKINTEYGFSNVYIVPRNSVSSIVSRKECDTSVSFNSFLQEEGMTTFEMPLMLSPMSFFGENAIRKVNNRFLTFLPRIQAYQFTGERAHPNWQDIDIRMGHAKKLHKDGFKFGVAISVLDDFEKILELCNYTDFLLVDTANGYSEKLHHFIRSINQFLSSKMNSVSFSKIKIITGNVVDTHGFCSLRDAGSHAIRLGIGGGSNCTTSDSTSVGRPPLSMLTEIYDFDWSCGGNSAGKICDGGIKSSGHLSLALLFAEYAMVSGIFKYSELNLHHEYFLTNPIDEYHNRIPAYGMASKYAKANDPSYVEGKITTGEATCFEEVYSQLKEGLQSSMSYLNAKTLEEYRRSHFELSYSSNY